MRWPWRRSREDEARDVVRDVIERHRRMAVEVVGLIDRRRDPQPPEQS